MRKIPEREPKKNINCNGKNKGPRERRWNQCFPFCLLFFSSDVWIDKNNNKPKRENEINQIKGKEEDELKWKGKRWLIKEEQMKCWY